MQIVIIRGSSPRHLAISTYLAHPPADPLFMRSRHSIQMQTHYVLGPESIPRSSSSVATHRADRGSYLTIERQFAAIHVMHDLRSLCPNCYNPESQASSFRRSTSFIFSESRRTVPHIRTLCPVASCGAPTLAQQHTEYETLVRSLLEVEPVALQE